jgi:carbamoyltransferase
MPHSLGGFFTGFTDFLGFKPEYHEGKLMGLAAYGRPNTDLLRKMERVLTLVGPRAYALDPSFFLYGRNHGNTYSEKLTRLFGQPRHGPGEHIEQPYKDLAYAVQNRLEEALSRLVQRAVAGTGKRMLCIAGGVALNCLANGRIASSGLVDRLFVSPVSNDAGTALGAALWVAKVAGYDPRQEMLHPYWGPGYSDDEVCTKLEKMGIPYQRCEQIETVAAREIAEGKTVAWFQGRMEIGPRALGGRSILGDPRTTDMRDKLNRIKGREPWRPLAPVILEEAVPDYFAGSGGSPFMTIAAPVRAEKQALVPAVVHVDGTTRPQVVTRATDTRYRRLVEAFAALTGIPAVVNTSFNTQGEPIVCSVEDAVRTFFGSGLDLLVAGSAIVKKAPTDVTD